MTIRHFNLDLVHPSWKNCLNDALTELDPQYLSTLSEHSDWLPGSEKIFNAFSLPVDQVNYVLFGESPYPRATSANGFAFWDAAVKELWCETGLCKPVNRATSLRNLIKMLLVADGKLNPTHTSQADIAALDKRNYVQTNTELFQNFIHHGFLLLNATPVLRENFVKKDAKAWQPFIKKILAFLVKHRPNVELILLGNIANTIDKLIPNVSIKKLYAEHPYNISFIQNAGVLDFFRPLRLLSTPFNHPTITLK